MLLNDPFTIGPKRRDFVPTICATCVVFRGLAVHWWKLPVFRPHRRKHCLDAAHSYACFYVVYASVCVGLLNGSADPPPAARLRIVFTARCYASALLAMGLCPSVRLSVTSRKAQFLGKILRHAHARLEAVENRYSQHDTPASHIRQMAARRYNLTCLLRFRRFTEFWLLFCGNNARKRLTADRQCDVISFRA